MENGNRKWANFGLKSLEICSFIKFSKKVHVKTMHGFPKKKIVP